MGATIPEAFLDLIDTPRVAALTTVMPDGQPQTTVVWCNYDGAHVLVNTMRGFQKERNMRRNPRVTLLCYDPREPLRSLEVRGTVVTMTEDGALEHLDALGERYTGVRPYFGACVAAELRERETPVLCRICPTRVVPLDARRQGDGCHSRPPAGARLPAAPREPRGLPPVTTPIPASHLDLLTRPIHGVLTTIMPDGQPQSSLVWCDSDGTHALVNTTRERQKGRNMQANPSVCLLVVDPEDTSRFVQIRGVAELVEEGALEHLDRLTRRYTRHPAFYGYVYPETRKAQETRVICRIHATRVTLDAIHR